MSKVAYLLHLFLVELGVEEDFVEGIECPHYPSDDNCVDQLQGIPMLTASENGIYIASSIASLLQTLLDYTQPI